MQAFNAEHLQEKWAPLLDHDGMGEIKDSHRRMVTAVLLENQEKILKEEQEFLGESFPTVALEYYNSKTGEIKEYGEEQP